MSAADNVEAVIWGLNRAAERGQGLRRHGGSTGLVEKSSRSAAFQGSVAEVASDIRRVRTLGADWVTFDLPRAGVPAMNRAIERLAQEVKPAAG